MLDHTHIDDVPLHASVDTGLKSAVIASAPAASTAASNHPTDTTSGMTSADRRASHRSSAAGERIAHAPLDGVWTIRVRGHRLSKKRTKRPATHRDAVELHDLDGNFDEQDFGGLGVGRCQDIVEASAIRAASEWCGEKELIIVAKRKTSVALFSRTVIA